MELCKKELTTDIGKLSYVVSGSPMAQPVVLMHGWGCNHTTVQSIQNLLTPRFKVLNVDFPGFGDSPEPETVWGVEEYAQLIERLIAEEQLESPILIGHSFGGRVAIKIAARANNIPKMVLIDAAGIKPKRSFSYYMKVYSYKLTKRLTRFFLGEERSRQISERAMRRRASADYLAASPRMRAIMSKVVNEDLRQLLSSIKASTLLVWGVNDTATPLSDAKTMERLIPDAGLVAFEDCGHYSFLDNPRQFAAVLNSFLR